MFTGELFFVISAADTSTNQQARANATVFTTQADSASQISGKTSFAVPAPPPLASAEKVRRLSDGEHFRQPNVTVSGHATVQKQLQEAQTQAQAQALADMILKVHFCSSVQDLSMLFFHSSNGFGWIIFWGGMRSNIFRHDLFIFYKRNLSQFSHHRRKFYHWK